MRSILVATDGSPGSDAAVAGGIELAREADAGVTFVYVRQPISLLGEPYSQRRLSEQLRAARTALGKALAKAAESGVEADSEILEGETAAQLLGLARARKADLLVIGSRGLGAVAGTLLGSVSRAVVKGAEQPILVVKEPQPNPMEVARGAERAASAS